VSTIQFTLFSITLFVDAVNDDPTNTLSVNELFEESPEPVKTC